MSKMDHHFKRQKTAKTQGGQSATNNFLADLQTQIETITNLSNDMEDILRKFGQQSNKWTELARRSDNEQFSPT